VNTWTTKRLYEWRKVLPSANCKKHSNLRGFVAGTAMNMATIGVISPQRRRCMEPKCQNLKKTRMKMGMQVLDPAKMGLQVLDPTKGVMVRLYQEWYYMAMRIMNVQIVHFFSGKIERVC
jgi:hypothetical protein